MITSGLFDAVHWQDQGYIRFPELHDGNVLDAAQLGNVKWSSLDCSMIGSVLDRVHTCDQQANPKSDPVHSASCTLLSLGTLGAIGILLQLSSH